MRAVDDSLSYRLMEKSAAWSPTVISVLLSGHGTGLQVMSRWVRSCRTSSTAAPQRTKFIWPFKHLEMQKCAGFWSSGVMVHLSECFRWTTSCCEPNPWDSERSLSYQLMRSFEHSAGSRNDELPK